MFGFLDMTDNYEDRKVKNFEKGDLIIDTAAILDSKEPYETAIIHPSYNNKEWVIVEMYPNKDAAIVGHEKWVCTMTSNVLPQKLIDVSTSEIAKFLDIAHKGGTAWRSNKVNRPTTPDNHL